MARDEAAQKMKDAGPVMGFYAINSHAVDYTELPKRFARDETQ